MLNRAKRDVEDAVPYGRDVEDAVPCKTA